MLWQNSKLVRNLKITCGSYYGRRSPREKGRERDRERDQTFQPYDAKIREVSLATKFRVKFVRAQTISARSGNCANHCCTIEKLRKSFLHDREIAQAFPALSENWANHSYTIGDCANHSCKIGQKFLHYFYTRM